MSQNVSLQLSQNPVQLAPGASTAMTVTLNYDGREVDRFDLSLEGLDRSWYAFDQTSIQLYPDPPGNEAFFTLQLNIPIDAFSGSYAPTLQVFSQNRNNIALSQPFVLLINPLIVDNPELNLEPASQETRLKVAHFQLNITNPTNQQIQVQLGARAANTKTRWIRLLPPVIDLPPLGQSISTVEIRTRSRNLIGPARRFDFRVGGENLKYVEGTMLQTAAWPWLRRMLTSPLFLIASILLPLLLLGLIVGLLWPTTAKSVQNNPQASVCAVSKSNVEASLQMHQDYTDILVTTPDGSRTRKVGSETTANLPGLFANLLSVSPDGKFLAYVTASDEAMSSAQIYLLNLTSQNSQRVVSVPSGLWPTRPIWSADSKQLGYVVLNNSQLELDSITLNSSDRKPQKVNLSTALTPELFYGDTPNGPVCGSADGNHWLVASKNSTAQVNPVLASAPVVSANPNPGLAPQQTGDCQVLAYSQNDPRWRDQQILNKTGTVEKADKISTVGCPIAAAAMLLNYDKVSSDPGELNSCLADDANPFDWLTVITKCSQGRLQAAQREVFNWDTLNSLLQGGQPVIVGLISQQSNQGVPSQASGIHYVIVTGGADSVASSYRVNDPWDGSSYKSLDDFLEVGYRLRWLVSYKENEALTCPDRTGFSHAQPGFKLQNPLPGIIYSQPISVDIQSDAGGQLTSALVSLPTNVNDNLKTDASGTSSGISNSDVISQEGVYFLSLSSSTDITTTNNFITPFSIDLTPPQISLKIPDNLFDPNINVNGLPIVSQSTFSLIFSATDSLSGISSIQYKYQLNDKDVFPDWQTYSSDISPKAVMLRDPGKYSVFFQATNGAGLTSTIQNFKFMLTKPGTIPAANTGTNPNGSTTVTVTNTPALGVATPSGNGSGTSNPPNSQQPPVAVGTTLAGDANGSGSGNTGGSSSSNGSSNPAPAAVTTSTGAGVLKSDVSKLTFNQNTKQVSLQLNDPGSVPVNWTLQPLSGTAASYLKFVQGGGSVPANSTLPMVVQLAAYNTTSAPVQADFSLIYNDGTAVLPVSVTIDPQPAPTVKFLSFPSGQLSTNPVPLQLQVTPNGLAQPDHAEFSAKFISKAGDAAVEQPITGTATAAGQWKFNWNIAALPPQDGIELYAKICWSSDSSNCAKVSPAITGLSIAKPSATISFSQSQSSNLPALVTVTAQIAGSFAVDHISYIYTFKGANNQTISQTLSTKATAANHYTVVWDTTAIPPQTGILFSAKVCWGTTDADTTCTSPANQIPPFTILAPTISVNPLSQADAASLPISLTLSGTTSNVNSAAASVWVDLKYQPGITATVQSISLPANLISSTVGTGNWTIGIDTSTWPPQTVSFTPKICSDGNPKGTLCFGTPSSLTGIIPDLSAQFVSPPADLSLPAILKITPFPTGKVTTVKLLVTYSDSSNVTHKDVALSTVASAANNFTIPFDSALLGLKSSQTIGLKLQACNSSGYCGKISSNPQLSLPIPNSTLSGLSSSLVLSGTVPIQATLQGRGVASLTFVAAYYQDPHVTSSQITQTVGTPLTNLVAGAPVNVNWDTSLIAPQNNIILSYSSCWGPGELGQSCVTQTASTNISIAMPTVSHVFLNGIGNGEYNLLNTLPIAYDQYSLGTVNLPVQVQVSSSNISAVKWRLQVQPAPPNFQPPLLATATVNAADLSATATIPINLVSLQAQGINLNNVSLSLQAIPVWNNLVDYPDGNSIKTLNLKLVTFSLQMLLGKNNFLSLLPSTPNSTPLMLNSTTFFDGIIGNNGGAVKRLIFSAGITNSLPVTLTSIPGPATMEAYPDPISGSWSFNWDHLRQAPRLLPQSGVVFSWRVCNTLGLDYSGCVPLTATGNLSQVGGLILGGIQFDPNNNSSLPLNNPNAYFNSTFSATVKIYSGQLAKQVRFYAYPSNISDPASKRVQLLTRPNAVISPDGNNWSLSVYWPDDTNPTPAHTVNTPTLLAALVNNQLSIGVQYCINSDPNISPDDLDCSDWSGQAMFAMTSTLNPNWKAALNGRQGIVTTWQSYISPTDTSDPYNSYIQQGTVTVRTPTVRIYTAPNAKVLNNSVNLSYASPSANINMSFIGAATNIGSNYYSYNWNVTGIPFVVDISTVRSVQLLANVGFSISNDSQNYQDTISVYTHGRSSDYVAPTHFVTPTTVIAATTTGTVAITTVTTFLPTPTPMPTSVTVVAPTTTSMPSTTPVPTTATSIAATPTSTPSPTTPVNTPTPTPSSTTPVNTPTPTPSPTTPVDTATPTPPQI